MALELPITAREIGERFNAVLTGRPDALIESLAPLSEASSHSLSFFTDRKYVNQLRMLNGTVVLTRPELVDPLVSVTFLAVDEPRTVFFKVLSELKMSPPTSGIISSEAKIHPSARIEAGVTIEAGASVGANSVVHCGSVLHHRAFVGERVTIGRDCELFQNVTLMDGVTLGDRVRIFPGTIIGSEGFGFFQDGQNHIAIPQVGTVIIGDDVRIGANCTIDRATLGATRIGRGTKLDNLVHIAHNCIIGKNCLICAQVGLGGSTILEDEVVLGGQVGLGDHVTVGKGARMGGQSGSSTNVRGNETYFLTPALPIKEVYRVVKGLKRLPRLFDRVRQLEERDKPNET